MRLFSIILLSSIFINFLFGNSYAQNANESDGPSIEFQNMCLDKEFCEQLAIQWWKWAYGISVDNNPGFDKTGSNCFLGEQELAWYLIGTFDAVPVNRDCSIPQDKIIFFPIYNSFCSPVEFSYLTTHNEMIECASNFQEKAVAMKATLNGISLPSISITTPVFNFSLPDNNIFGVPSGIYEGAGSGEYVGIGLLEPGSYVLRFSGTTESTATSLNDFIQDNVYRLHIEP